jgi:hypothetical protein
MPIERENERFAREIVKKYLSTEVKIHDTGLKPSMVDLLIELHNESAPLEITSATTQRHMKLMNELQKPNATKYIIPGWKNQWFFFAGEGLTVKNLKENLQSLPSSVEDELLHMGHTFMPPFRLKRLGIEGAMKWPAGAPGEVLLGVHIEHGPIEIPDITGDWVSDFLQQPEQKDVLSKVGKYKTSQRHVFIWAEPTVPRPVRIALSQASYRKLPIKPPQLPTEVTHLWLGALHHTPTVIAWFPDDIGWREVSSPQMNIL